MRELRLISMPFEGGRRAVGMGNGAARLAADEGVRAALRNGGWSIPAAVEIEAVDESRTEVWRSVEVIRRLAVAVKRATDEGAVPLVLAGDCNSSLGTVAGVGAAGLGVIWLDAHADFDDPDENISGYFDVMGLAMLTGRGWSALRATIPGLQPVPERNVLLAAARDLEPYQRATMQRSQLLVVGDEIDESQFDAALAELSSRVSRVYLHVDLDALDSEVARVNTYAAPGGPDVERVCRCVRSVCERFAVAAASMTAYDPAFDDGDRALVAAREIAGAIAAGG